MTSSTRSTLQTFAIFVMVVVAAAFLFRQVDRPRKQLADNIRLAQLDVVPLAGGARPIKLEDLSGKTVLINFWGTWCPPCLEEFPHLAALEKQYRDRKDFVLLSISATGRWPEDIAGLRESTDGFMSLGNYKTPIYADPTGRTRMALKDAVDPHVFPATVLINREGKAVGAWEGFRPAEFDQIKLQLASELAKGS